MLKKIMLYVSDHGKTKLSCRSVFCVLLGHAVGLWEEIGPLKENPHKPIKNEQTPFSENQRNVLYVY